MANPTLQLHFGYRRATPPVSHSHNRPSGRMQHFFVQNRTKKCIFANQDTKTNFDACMILQKPALSLKGNVFLNGQFEGDIIFCHLNQFTCVTSNISHILNVVIKGFHKTNEALLIYNLISKTQWVTVTIGGILKPLWYDVGAIPRHIKYLIDGSSTSIIH